MGTPIKEGDLAQQLYQVIDSALKDFQYQLEHKLQGRSAQAGTARVYASNAIARAIAYAVVVATTDGIEPEPGTRQDPPPKSLPNAN